jgi:hypothetical protein
MFTITEKNVNKKLFSLVNEKKGFVVSEFMKKLKI